MEGPWEFAFPVQERAKRRPFKGIEGAKRVLVPKGFDHWADLLESHLQESIMFHRFA
jgi:hypothetical protein